MGEGFSVNPEQVSMHAGSVEAVREGFGRVKGASAFIAGDDAAYGILCAWMAGILHERHAKQDELFDYVEENLQLISDGLRDTAKAYTEAEAAIADRIAAITRGLSGG